MILGILKENRYHRVAIVPAAFKKLSALGLTMTVESGAGVKASVLDQQYTDAGATVTSRADILAKSDIIVSIEPLPASDLLQIKKGALYISMLAPYQNADVVSALSAYPIHVVSMDMIPRTTLAQSMDVLSSMASLAGYKAVLTAANYYPHMFPMMMTAAGTIPPTKVLVLGAGVAGLQAIATAKRLGAVVEAFDTRTAAKEEVQSLGATFVEVPGAVDDRGAGGYAVQQSDEYLAKQRALVQEKALKANIIIATAQVRGRQAPLLVTSETVDQMRPGSVIVDLAASTGGNCAYTENNNCITHNGVTILGNSDLADEVSNVASTLFANNIVYFLQTVVKEGVLTLDKSNEIIASALISSPQ
jgi:H+-translocating NAD(P) transhydrogenase subunit alpha